MPPTFRGYAGAVKQVLATSWIISVPTVVDGDSMLMGILSEVGDTITPPAGWTPYTFGDVGPSLLRITTYQKIAASEPANYTVGTDGTSGVGFIGTTALPLIPSPTPDDAQDVENPPPCTCVLPLVPDTLTGQTILYIGAILDGSNNEPVFTIDPATTEAGETVSDGTAGFGNQGIFLSSEVATGSQPSRTFIGTSPVNANHRMAVARAVVLQAPAVGGPGFGFIESAPAFASV